MARANSDRIFIPFLVLWIVEHSSHESRFGLFCINPAKAPLFHVVMHSAAALHRLYCNTCFSCNQEVDLDRFFRFATDPRILSFNVIELCVLQTPTNAVEYMEIRRLAYSMPEKQVRQTRQRLAKQMNVQALDWQADRFREFVSVTFNFKSL